MSAAPTAAPPDADVHPSRWRILLLLSVAELLGMSLWFAASAVSAQYRALWGLTASEAGWLTTIVQLGFVAGTAASAVLNLADVVPARRLFAVCALGGAAANAEVVRERPWRLATGGYLGHMWELYPAK